MPVDIKNISVSGFKSFRRVDRFEPRPLNVLIGTNGSGKSNFLTLFKLLSHMYATMDGFSGFVGKQGGASALLFGGPKLTESIRVQLVLQTERGENDCEFRVTQGVRNTLIFNEERYRFRPKGVPVVPDQGWITCGHGHENPVLNHLAGDGQQTAKVIRGLLRSVEVFQFHDTSFNSPLRRGWDSSETHFFRTEGGNVPALLLAMRENQPDRYRHFVEVCRIALPFLDDFVLEVTNGQVHLDWKERWNSDNRFSAHQASDGMLRFVALMTLLHQAPEDMPEVLVIDEPELGLHPAALSVVMDYVKSAAENGCQVFLATQSLSLIDMCEPEDVVVVERDSDGASTLRRLDRDQLAIWLEDYSLSQLWQSNTLGGSLA